MGPILYLNRTGRRFREPLIPKKEKPSLASSPISGGWIAWGTGWSKPTRLPDTVNLVGQSIWKPSIAADGTIYFVSIGIIRYYAVVA